MNFETLINSPKEVIKEYLEKPESLKEIGCSISQVGELIKVAGESITYVENFEKFKDILDIFIDGENFSDDDAKELGRIMVEWIKDTGKAEEYLNKFSEKSGIEKKYIQKWIPIVAAAHLSKASEEEKTFLINWIDVVDYA